MASDTSGFECTLCDEPPATFTIWEGFYYAHFVPAHFSSHRRTFGRGIDLELQDRGLDELNKESGSSNDGAGSAMDDNEDDIGVGISDSRRSSSVGRSDDDDVRNSGLDIDIDDDAGASSAESDDTGSSSSGYLEQDEEGSDVEDEDEVGLDDIPSDLHSRPLHPYEDEHGNIVDEELRQQLKILYYCLREKKSRRAYLALLDLLQELRVDISIFPSTFGQLMKIGVREVRNPLVQMAELGVVFREEALGEGLSVAVFKHLTWPTLKGLFGTSCGVHRMTGRCFKSFKEDVLQNCVLILARAHLCGVDIGGLPIALNGEIDGVRELNHRDALVTIAKADIRRYGARILSAAVDAILVRLNMADSATYLEEMVKAPGRDRKAWIARFGLPWTESFDDEHQFATCVILAAGVMKIDGPEHWKTAVRRLAAVIALGEAEFTSLFGVITDKSDGNWFDGVDSWL